jgi:hypothetical protein
VTLLSLGWRRRRGPTSQLGLGPQICRKFTLPVAQRTLDQDPGLVGGELVPSTTLGHVVSNLSRRESLWNVEAEVEAVLQLVLGLGRCAFGLEPAPLEAVAFVVEEASLKQVELYGCVCGAAGRGGRGGGQLTFLEFAAGVEGLQLGR